MRIEVGPVSHASARAWLDYAARVLSVLRNTESMSVSEAALDGFEQLLDEWSAVADDDSETFHWTSQWPADQVEYLVKALYEAGLVIEDRHERGEADLRPAEADEFHVAIVNQMLAALVQEGGSFAQFVEMLRTEWGIAGDA